MAALLGTILAKLLSIAGIGGLIAGHFTRTWPVAVAAGLAMGILDTLLLGGLHRTTAIDWGVAIVVAVLTATLSWRFRGRKQY